MGIKVYIHPYWVSNTLTKTVCVCVCSSELLFSWVTVTGFSSGPEASSQLETMYSTAPEQQTHTLIWTHVELGDGVKERLFCQTTEYQRCSWYHTRVRVFVRLHRLLELSGALNHGCNGQHYRQRQQADDECPSLRANPDLLFCCDAQKALTLSPKNTHTCAFLRTNSLHQHIHLEKKKKKKNIGEANEQMHEKCFHTHTSKHTLLFHRWFWAHF